MEGVPRSNANKARSIMPAHALSPDAILAAVNRIDEFQQRLCRSSIEMTRRKVNDIFFRSVHKEPFRYWAGALVVWAERHPSCGGWVIKLFLTGLIRGRPGPPLRPAACQPL